MNKNGKDYFLDFVKKSKLPIHQFLFNHYKKQTQNNPSSMAIFDKKLRSIANTIKDEYIKKYVPELKNIPHKYLYTPWECPSEILSEINLKLGVDYPFPVVDIKLSREKALKAFSILKK